MLCMAVFALGGLVPSPEPLRRSPGPLRYRAATKREARAGRVLPRAVRGHTGLHGAHTLRGFCRRRPVRQPGRKRHCPWPALHSPVHISLLFAGAADVVPNNGAPSQDTAVTDSKRTADPKNAWPEASPADPGGRPHLVRLFSRDAPGREDNTFKDRPSESDELQTIQEDSAAAPGAVDAMAAQKRPSQRSKYLASDRGAPKRGSGKVPWLKQSKSPLGPHARSPPGLCNMYQDGHHAARTTHYGSLPQKAQHGRPQDENPVVHFFKNIVTPRTPPPSQGKGRGLSLSRFSWGAEGQKPGFGYGGRASDYKSAHKGLKGHDAQGTLSKIFKLGGRDSRSGSPMARR
uniref:Myelin basic protein n=1 Tax=Bos indicus x Bos taurus TaxID=30522 RepID=A0A4W2DL56_BOBOX